MTDRHDNRGHEGTWRLVRARLVGLLRSCLGSRPRTLRLCEMLSLGDKRFLAVVRVEQQRFLVGGAGNSISLLVKLPSTRENDTQ